MARPARILPVYRGILRWDAHSLRFQCHNGWELFHAPRARKIFIEYLQAAREEMNFDLWAYVIMLDHVHLLIWPRENVSSMVETANRIRDPMTARATREGIIKGPPFWDMGAHFDHPLDTVPNIHQTMWRIHDNPIRRNLVDAQEDWRYSSARFWMGLDERPLEMDLTVPRRDDIREPEE